MIKIFKQVAKLIDDIEAEKIHISDLEMRVRVSNNYIELLEERIKKLEENHSDGVGT